MTEQQRAAMQAALEALETVEVKDDEVWRVPYLCHQAIEALRAALAQQEQAGPVGIVQALDVTGHPMPNSSGVEWLRPVPLGAKLFIAPPQRKPLTRTEINKLMADVGWQNSALRQADLDKVEKIVRAIERARGIGGEHE